MRLAVVLAALALPLTMAGCGAARELKPRPGETLPVAPYGARETPTRDQLIRATTQQRPARSDDLLTSSQARRDDRFDLPPSGDPMPAPSPSPSPSPSPTPAAAAAAQ